MLTEPGPGILQADGAVEDEAARFAVIVDTEVTQPLELKFVKG